MNKTKRLSVKIVRSKLVYDETIALLAKEITKLQLNVIEGVSSQYGKSHMMELIQYILSKRQKTQDDMTVVVEYLKTLSDFTTSIKGDNDGPYINDILNKIVKSLSVQAVSNSIMFRIGERGAHFYIILKGTVSVLIPKETKHQLTPDEYLTHLYFLNQINEYELLSKTVNSNKSVYNVDITNPSCPIIRNLTNKSPANSEPRPIRSETVEEYISNMMPISLQEDKSIYPYLSIWIYQKVINLGEGRTFGEQALISKNSLRTATIFANEETILGILNEIDFSTSIKCIQMQTKNENILFIMKYNIFGSVSFDYFTKHLWNNFIFIKKKSGDILFNQNDNREMIYFIKEGEFELTSRLSQTDINRLLIYFGVNQNILMKEYNSDTVKTLKHCTVKCNTLLGVDDILFPSKHYFCSAQCTSKTAEIFGINIQNLLNIIDFADSYKEFNKMIIGKINIMINRLQSFKLIDNILYTRNLHTTLQGEKLSHLSRSQREYSHKINTVRRKMIFIDIHKLKKKMKFNPLSNDTDCKISLSQRKHMPIKLDTIQPSYLLNKTPKATSNRLCIKTNTDVNKKKHSTVLFASMIPRLDMKYKSFSFKTSLKAKDTISKPQIIDLYTTSFLENQHKLNSLRNQMERKHPNKNIIYSKIVLNSDYSIKVTQDVHTMMDYCITEESKL